jgi:hypothetical protein
VVLLPVEGEVNGRLAEALASRHWHPSTHHDPFLALAELGLRDRAQASRAAWGLQPSEQAVLLLGQRDLLERGRVDCDALVDAVRRFLPRVKIFEFTSGRLLEQAASGAAIEAPAGTFSARGRSPADRSPPPTPAEPVEAIPPPGMLRLTHPPEPPPVEMTEPRPQNGLPLLEEEDEAHDAAGGGVTREEIDMLLELDPGETTP